MPQALDLAREYLRVHPDAAAEALEDAGAEPATALLAELPPADAAIATGHMPPAFAASCLASMPDQKAGPILDRLSARNAAAILRYVDSDRRSALVQTIGRTRRAHVALILRQPLRTIGAWIDARVPYARRDETVLDARARLAQLDAAFDRLFVVDGDHRLIGSVRISVLLQADPASVIGAVDLASPEALPAGMSVDAALEERCWESDDMQPVTDAAGRLMGVIRFADLRRSAAQIEHRRPADHESATLEITHMVYLGLAEAMRIGLAELIGRNNGQGTENRR